MLIHDVDVHPSIDVCLKYIKSSRASKSKRKTGPRITWTEGMIEALIDLENKYSKNSATNSRKWKFVVQDLKERYPQHEFTTSKCTAAFQNFRKRNKANVK